MNSSEKPQKKWNTIMYTKYQLETTTNRIDKIYFLTALKKRCVKLMISARTAADNIDVRLRRRVNKPSADASRFWEMAMIRNILLYVK